MPQGDTEKDPQVNISATENEEGGVPLTPEESVDMAEANTLTEVYCTDNEFAATVAIDEVLGAEGITAFRHDRRSHAIPAPASMPGQIGIAVPESLADEARSLLRQALLDGVLLEDGQVVEGDAVA